MSAPFSFAIRATPPFPASDLSPCWLTWRHSTEQPSGKDKLKGDSIAASHASPKTAKWRWIVCVLFPSMHQQPLSVKRRRKPNSQLDQVQLPSRRSLGRSCGGSLLLDGDTPPPGRRPLHVVLFRRFCFLSDGFSIYLFCAAVLLCVEPGTLRALC